MVILRQQIWHNKDTCVTQLREGEVKCHKHNTMRADLPNTNTSLPHLSLLTLLLSFQFNSQDPVHCGEVACSLPVHAPGHHSLVPGACCCPAAACSPSENSNQFYLNLALLPYLSNVYLMMMLKDDINIIRMN